MRKAGSQAAGGKVDRAGGKTGGKVGVPAQAAAYAAILAFVLRAPIVLYAQAGLAPARARLAQADYSGAETLLRSALSLTPASADAHYLLALTLFHQNKPKESLAEYTAAARLRVPAPEELMGVASDYILLADYPDADHWLTLVTQQAPTLAQAWYLLGRTQYNESRPADAERSFLTCLRIEPRHLRAEYNLGLVYQNTQRPTQAIAAYQTAIAWQENSGHKDPQPLLDLGMLLRQQGHAAEALPYLTAAASAGPRNPIAHQELGLAYEQLDRPADAIAQLELALTLAPDTESLHFFLGRLYRRAGRTDDAARQFAEATRLSGTRSNDGTPNQDVGP